MEYAVFRFHFLLGADSALCCERLKVDRGTFNHSVYRMQEKAGRAFRETEPYGIFPLAGYFCGITENQRAKTRIKALNRFQPARPPLRAPSIIVHNSGDIFRLPTDSPAPQ